MQTSIEVCIDLKKLGLSQFITPLFSTVGSQMGWMGLSILQFISCLAQSASQEVWKRRKPSLESQIQGVDVPSSQSSSLKGSSLPGTHPLDFLGNTCSHQAWIQRC